MAASRSLLSSIGLLSVCSVGQMLLQQVFQVLLARLFGASGEMDAFTAALALPGVVSAVIGATLPAVLIPVLIHRRESLGEEAARETATLVTVLVGVGLTGLCLCARWGAEPLMRTLQPGFTSDQVLQTAVLFRTLVWLIWAQSLAALLQSISHADQQYLVPALAPCAGVMCTVGWTWSWSSQEGIDAVTAGVVAGSLVNVGLQLSALAGQGRLPRSWDAGTGRIWRLVWPLLLGALYTKLDPVVDRYLASSLSAGSISQLGYAVRVIGVLLTLSTSGLAVVVFPVLSQHAALGQEQELKGAVFWAFRFLIFTLTPLVVGLALFHRPVIRDLLEHGHFTAADTEVVGTLVALSLGMLVAASVGEILARVFFAIRDPRTPLVIGIAGFTVGVLFKWLLVGVLGLEGLLLATSGYYLLNVVCLYWVLSRRLGGLMPPDIGVVTGRALLGSGGAALMAFVILQLPYPLISLAAGAGAGGVYLALMAWAGDEFARSLIRRIRAGWPVGRSG